MGFYTTGLSAVAVRAKGEPINDRGVGFEKRPVRFFRGGRHPSPRPRQTKSPASKAVHAVVLRTTAPGVPLYGYRHLSPELGRWVSRDPIWEDGFINQIKAKSKQTFMNMTIGLSKVATICSIPPHDSE